MPIKQSAKKFIKSSGKRRLRNKSIKEKIAALIKKTKQLVSSKKQKEAEEAFKSAAKMIDKAAQKKIIKKNTAARKKSRLAKLLKQPKSSK